MKFNKGRVVLATAGIFLAGTGAGSAEVALTFALNWNPRADHAAYYYAEKMGWYDEAGLNVIIEPGRGSGATVQRVASGAANMGLADFGTMLTANGKGGQLTAVMAVYQSSPYYFYWLKGKGISGPADFAGKTVGAPAGDAAVAMWPSFASKVGLPVDSVSFVNMAPAAKLASLKSGAVDIVPYFYDSHATIMNDLGDSVEYIGWKDVGINPYGNAIFVNQPFMAENPEAVKAFVQVSQRAMLECMRDIAPCYAVMKENTSGLNDELELANWENMKVLMDSELAAEKGLGWFDPARVASDYELIAGTIGIETPFSPESAFTNDLLDTEVKLDRSTIPATN